MVLYTGNTQAHLEPCGCFVGQSGGLPRRATAISQISARGFSPLTIDLGDVLPSEGPKMAARFRGDCRSRMEPWVSGLPPQRIGYQPWIVCAWALR